jgi:predicted glycosyl hydrolase (DUF1957 family)
MKIDPLAKAFYIKWAELGVRVCRTDISGQHEIIWIEVPSSSYARDDDGTELSGMHLAKYFLHCHKCVVPDIEVRAKVIDEYWSEEQAKNARYSLMLMYKYYQL